MNVKKTPVPDKDLIWAMTFCFALGLMLMIFSVWFYLCYWDKIQLDELSSDNSAEDTLALIRVLTFGILPLLSFAFFCVGYVVWKHYDQSRSPRNPLNQP